MPAGGAAKPAEPVDKAHRGRVVRAGSTACGGKTATRDGDHQEGGARCRPSQQAPRPCPRKTRLFLAGQLFLAGWLFLAGRLFPAGQLFLAGRLFPAGQLFLAGWPLSGAQPGEERQQRGEVRV